MRIGELSQRSGVPIPTIKYYLREGLLHAGETRAANQAAYGDDHLRRLRLIRALIDVGGVSVSAAADVISALNDDDLASHDLLGAAHIAVMPTRHPDRETPSWQAARTQAAKIVTERGWLVSPLTPALDQLADVLSALTDLGLTDFLDRLDSYLRAAETLATVEVDAVVARPDRESMVELVVVGTVLGEALFAALRLLAHEHRSAERLGRSPATMPGA
jgi:DNA-binding transcriptional MerR regulator